MFSFLMSSFSTSLFSTSYILNDKGGLTLFQSKVFEVLKIKVFLVSKYSVSSSMSSISLSKSSNANPVLKFFKFIVFFSLSVLNFSQF